MTSNNKTMRPAILRIISIVLILLLASGLLSGCKKKNNEQNQPQTEEQELAEEPASEGDSGDNTDSDSDSNAEPEQEPVSEGTGEGDSEVDTIPEEEAALDEDGYYYSKDDVARYLHIYGHLPDNYMTKKEAKKLGWSGGSLEKYAPNMVIGGDRFGNYEGNLPDGNYTECDIDTLGKKKRGSKRIVFSDDGYIYYTEDHYETFELLYAPDAA